MADTGERVRQELGIERIGESQNLDVLRPIVEDVRSVLTENESIFYVAHQAWTALGQKRDAVAATNNRMIIFQRHRLRGFDFHDFLWEDVENVKINQNMLSSSLDCTLTNGETYQTSNLVKDQARTLYTICQQKEQEWRERRRVRKMEEERARAGGTQITLPEGGDVGPTAPAEDPVAKLAKAKEMFEKELISEAEYETLKANILQKM
jgi:hypothetical protein